ncbi:ATP-binding cassette domain-containing protein [Neobacillus sp. PS2-9]|uniref:ABC transporter ATP-binding protein n=1 Tax=Neobacillus sp. PS2-9 TaxID=3070676 RepID=UPI0027E1D6D0|nr:ATP-binding cassette domain-containing protein [Neobacillus sp. PS2-9]WML58604.1 ATP-binding cassette domain-containing protein [Neobacillus sp. PS2-9]
MNARPKVIFNNVSKQYTLKQKKLDKLLDLILLKRNGKSFSALRNVSFTVNEGETIGIVGINGSGKSTLSNLLAQVVPPSSGDIEINGETSLIAISVGLNNNLTGLENIELKCLMHGLKKDEIKRITPSIIDFADIGDFIDQPVKNYSSGMKSRLGFAISAHTNPDIMVVDEALSVGDQTFYTKCINKMNEFKKEGKTIFFISHSVSQIRSFCDRTMWIHYGEMVEFGETKTVLQNYNKFINHFNGLNDEEKRKYKKDKITEQKTNNISKSELASRSDRSPKKEKKSFKTSFELALLFALFIFCTFLMLKGDGVAKEVKSLFKPDPKVESKALDEKEIKKSAVKEKRHTESINQVGYITSEIEPVYQTDRLQKKLNTLSFATEVYVTNKIDNAFEITMNNKKGYVGLDSLYIPDSPLKQKDFNIKSFLDGFPESFVRSYQYYLAFIGSDQEKIEKKIRGKTGESLDESDNKYIEFGQLKYRILSNKLSDELIVSEIDPQKMDTNLLIENATLISKDHEIIDIMTTTNEFIFNLKNKTVTIKAAE